MNKFSFRFLLACSLLVPAVATALDNSAAVKAVPILKTANSWDGKPLEYPAGKAQVTGMIIELAPGAETGWHSHAVPSFAMVLEGELEIRLQNGLTKRLSAGQAVAEVVDTPHNGRNVGEGPVKLVVFYTGAEGSTLTTMLGK